MKYIAPEDIHIYSVDEVFMDVTSYLNVYHMTARELAMMMIRDVLKTTGITATAGIGTNLYLCKIAMDIVAKHIESVGKTNELYNEDLLYKLFGINAELLIDHAWGYEPCTMDQIKAYKPETNSICTGQVLHCPYDFDKTRLVVKEMTDLMSLDLVDKGLVTDQIVLTIGYDIDNLTDLARKKRYKGAVTTDRYGRKVPKHAHGTINLKRQTSSTQILMDAVMELYDRIVDKDLLIRRINITANKLVDEHTVTNDDAYEQLDFFTDYEAVKKQREKEEANLERERHMQEAMLNIKKKYGKNAILKGMNLQEGATAKDRNAQIGGHKA